MSWVTFDTKGGGVVAVQARNVAAIYDERGIVKLSTTAGDVHILEGTTVRRALMRLTDASDAETELAPSR